MNYFGTDGIRGKPNEKLTVEFAVKIGKALHCLGNENICLATDTRNSKDMLAYGIAAGALSLGMNVYHLRVLPTPALIYYSLQHQMTGIMVTASHNPYQDNGIKIINKGKKLSLEEEIMIEKEIDSFDGPSHKIGSFYAADGKLEYIQFIQEKLVPTDLKVVMDCANGATSYLAFDIFQKYVPNLIITSAGPDGYNINLNCGSTHLDFLRKKVIQNHCDIGFAYDGDGDRVLCVDRNGKIIEGDFLIYIIAKYLSNKNKLKNNQVVLSQMSNLGIIKSFNQLGICVQQTDVGDKYILKELIQNQLSLGGENSGHIIITDELCTGDGMLVAGYILRILNETNTALEDWIKEITLYPQCLTNVKVSNKKEILNDDRLKNQISAIQQELNGDCKVFVRASGTEDVIRILVMAKEEVLVKKYTKQLVNLVEEIKFEYCNHTSRWERQ